MSHQLILTTPYFHGCEGFLIPIRDLILYQSGSQLNENRFETALPVEAEISPDQTRLIVITRPQDLKAINVRKNDILILDSWVLTYVSEYASQFEGIVTMINKTTQNERGLYVIAGSLGNGYGIWKVGSTEDNKLVPTEKCLSQRLIELGFGIERENEMVVS